MDKKIKRKVDKTKPRKVDVRITESCFLTDMEKIAEAIGYTEMPKGMAEDVRVMPRLEAKILIGEYLQAMDKRISAGNQVKSLKKREEHKPKEEQRQPAVLTWFHKNAAKQEQLINTAVRYWAEQQPMARWAMQFRGISHGIAAALVAYIDPEKALTAGDVWSIFGVNPQQEWLGADKSKAWVKAQKGTPLEILARASETFHRNYHSMLKYATTDAKGKRVKLTRDQIVKTLALRPWNARCKVLQHYIGDSFCKNKGFVDASTYSLSYDERKAYETARNEAGLYAAQAAAKLREVPDHEQRAILKQGKLAPGHIHNRVLRWVAKRFLADFQQEMYRQHFHKEPPKPYVFSHLGHAHLQDPLGKNKAEAQLNTDAQRNADAA